MEESTGKQCTDSDGEAEKECLSRVEDRRWGMLSAAVLLHAVVLRMMAVIL